MPTTLTTIANKTIFTHKNSLKPQKSKPNLQINAEIDIENDSLRISA